MVPDGRHVLSAGRPGLRDRPDGDRRQGAQGEKFTAPLKATARSDFLIGTGSAALIRNLVVLRCQGSNLSGHYVNCGVYSACGT